MTKKESPKMQEMGPKKYKAMQEKSFKEYDQFKAGKTDPKTGVYYNEINFGKPKNSKISSGCLIADFECHTEGCGNFITVRRNTAGISCGKCSKYHSVTVDRLTDRLLKVNGVELDEHGRQSKPTTTKPE